MSLVAHIPGSPQGSASSKLLSPTCHWWDGHGSVRRSMWEIIEVKKLHCSEKPKVITIFGSVSQG